MKMKDLKKQYEVKRIDETENKEYLVWNAKDGSRRYHDTLEDAYYTLGHDQNIWKRNKPIVVNGMGIETESDLHNHKFRWIIRWRWVSKWEEI